MNPQKLEKLINGNFRSEGKRLIGVHKGGDFPARGKNSLTAEPPEMYQVCDRQHLCVIASFNLSKKSIAKQRKHFLAYMLQQNIYIIQICQLQKNSHPGGRYSGLVSSSSSFFV